MKWLFAIACAFPIIAIIVVNVFGSGKKKTEYFYNSHCKFETGNELVCFVDALNWEAKNKDLYEKDGVSFCGAFTT